MKLIIFNQDLRIYDNPALFFACQKALDDGQEILPIFILDEVNKRKLGGASKWFLYFALDELQKNLQEKLGLKLHFFKGDSLQILSSLKVEEIYFNKLYEPFNIKLEKQIKDLSKSRNIAVFDFESYLLFDPQKIKNGSGNYFKVFTPFWKNCLKNWQMVNEPLSLPNSASGAVIKNNFSADLESLNLLPKNPNWAKDFHNIWVFERKKILENFEFFLENNLKDYQETRNLPALNATSKLSAYLHFGLISVQEIIHLVKNHHQENPDHKAGTACFLSEIGWREFSHYLLFHFPELPTRNFKKQFDNFVWENDPKMLEKWQKGKTGYPIIDAAMQEIWQTGFMQNRVRMIVASFLIKDLFVDWRCGEEWFWDCLTDANLANNSASWQWVAGSGADASPYFRIFNPVLQSEKFDPNGDYIKKYLPVLKNVPAKFIHKPWELSDADLAKFGVVLGQNYPKRIVLHEQARIKAMELYTKNKSIDSF